ncbi:MAG: methyltransferase domain-containing protein [Actinobacteria bacterium]|nr:methyltransferase domain-containing protein [Actinomycetota bacterium]
MTVTSDAAIRRLNWGCGDHVRTGWVNSDLKSGTHIDVTTDVRDGLPFEDAEFDYIVSVHALQMLSYPEIVPALVELRRVLRPEGVLRLCLPDLEKGIDAYRAGNADHFQVPDEELRSLGGKFIVHMLWYGWSVTLFTLDFIGELLDRAGFRDVSPCGYQRSPSGLEGITDLDNRPHESLFVEATR